MPHRRILIGILLLSLVLLAGYGLLWWRFVPPASAINRANAMKITPGMTLAEVEAILGGPARDESGLIEEAETCLTPRTFTTPDGRMWVPGVRDTYRAFDEADAGHLSRVGDFTKLQSRSWRNRSASIEVTCNPDNRVILIRYFSIRPAEPTFVERTREWITNRITP